MNKSLHTLDAVTALDGRYRDVVEELSKYISEKALIRSRFEVEVRYLIALSDAGIIRNFTKNERTHLETLIQDFSDADAEKVKEIEETTRHDVKAVEYAIREKLDGSTLHDVKEKLHLFLTSEDINNLSQRIILKQAIEFVVIPKLQSLIGNIVDKAEEYAEVPMLARTHGQNAVPTTFGKELLVFAERLNREIEKLEHFQFSGKLSGAVGNYNSFAFASDMTYTKWLEFSDNFVKQFGFQINPVTTQINTPEDIIEVLQIVQRTNGIGIDLASDCWRYISDGWLIQMKIKGEVGSSTMPQKINPIDFENGEGNLSLSNDVITGLVTRLPISRLQRDLRDSTQLRSIGLILGYMVLGFSNIMRGFGKVEINREILVETLNSDWSILSEAAQTYLRVSGEVEDPYAMFKDVTRGKKLSQKGWKEAIESLQISDKAKKELLGLTPENYTGFAKEIGQASIKRLKSKIK